MLRKVPVTGPPGETLPPNAIHESMFSLYQKENKEEEEREERKGQ